MSAIARFVLRHPRKIIGFWVVVLLISLAGASRLSDRVQNGGYAASGSGAVRAGEISEHKFGPVSEPQAYLSVLAEHRSHGLHGREVGQAANAVRGVEGVKLVGAPVVSADGQAALMPVTFAGSYGYAQTRVPDVEAALEHASLAGASARLIGQVGIYQRYMVSSKKSLQTSSLISFPVTLVILLVAFLSVVAALLPLGLAAVCVGVTFGFLYLLTYVVQLSVFVEDTVLILGLGLSIDFSLFMVTRVREGLRR
jgi:RND superfamily putative drug exporter